MVPNGWKVSNLGKVAKWSSGGTPSKARFDFWNGSIPWISAVSMRGHSFSNSELSISDLAVKCGAKMAVAGDVLLLVRGSMLWNKIPVGVATRYLSFNQDVKCLSPISELIKSQFLLYWFLANENMLMHLVTGTGIGAGKLDTSTLQALEIALPNIKEQQKIAKIISTWDKAISTTECLIDNSKQQKKGLMQQLISGNKRLLGNSGKPFKGAWEQLPLVQLFKLSTARSKSKHVEKVGGNFIIDMGSVSRHGKLIPSKRTSLSKDYLSKGQLVMPKDDIGGGHIIGRIGYIPENNKYILSDHVYCLTSLRGSPLFLSYLINSDLVNKQLRRKANGTAQLGLGKKDVERQTLNLPNEIKEQQKIATVLINADKETELLEQQLVDLKQEKKALMQQLLTGKRRVKTDEMESA